MKIKHDQDPASVLFFDITRGGRLVEELRIVDKKLFHIIGDSFKIVEKAGTPVVEILV